MPTGTNRVVNVTIAAAGFVERRTRLLLASPAATLTLIPSSFDLASFDAMARTHEGQLVRWTTTPNLTIQRNRACSSSSASCSALPSRSTGSRGSTTISPRACCGRWRKSVGR